MTPSEAISEIQSIFLTNFRPIVLNLEVIDENPQYIHIVVCSRYFEKTPVNERTTKLFDLIKLNNPDILENILVIEAFTFSEMEDIYEYL